MHVVLSTQIEHAGRKGPLESFILDCYRPYWRCYYSNTDAIIYVVDSADKDRIGISKDELLYMLRVSVSSNTVSGSLSKGTTRETVSVSLPISCL
jgi:hypothetical protein